MLNASVKGYSKACWFEIYNRIIGAVVFIDDATAECLHWDGGLLNLLTSGAVEVKRLSPFEVSKEHQKGVFITQATSTQLHSIQNIIKFSDFSDCILISTVSMDVVYLELNDGCDVSDVMASGKAHAEGTKLLANMLIEWINKMPSAAEVVHVPIFTISPTNVVFLTPPHSKLYPSYEGKLIPESPSIDLQSLSSEERSSVRRFASSLNSLFEAMNIKEDIFYMGTFSSIVAGILEYSPICTARRKTCSNPVSLILVDRTLDLCSVTSHNLESVLDKVMAVLPRFPGHSTDVCVDMSPVCEANVVNVAEDIQLCPGCLYHPGDESCMQTFDHMINKSQKEVMFDLYNKLSKVDVQGSPGPKTLMKVTPQTIEKIFRAAKGNYDVIEKHLGVLQQSLGVVQMVKSPQYAQCELLAGFEEQVIQNIATSKQSTSVLTQISKLIKTRKDRNLSLERLLVLLVHIYSLVGSDIIFSQQHEDVLEEILSVAIFEDHKILFPTVLENPNMVSPEECEEIAKKIMKKLRNVAQMRKILVKYNSVLKSTEAGSKLERRGVLQQLVEDLVSSERPDIPDLKHRNEGLKDFLRSGLNILTSKKSRTVKRPLDRSLVIIFLIGGITAEECKRLHRTMITSGVDAQLLIGSTKFVTPSEAMRDALQL